MKRRMNLQWSDRLTAAALLASLLAAPAANAELVFDEEAQSAPVAVDASTRTMEREATREVLQSSERAKATQATEASAVMTAQPVMAETAPVASVMVAAAPEIQHLSKAELMRRERMREELKNEDLLQERLEQLRLRDEQRRSGALAATTAEATMALGTAPVATGTQAIVTEQAVVAPVTVTPGQVAEAPARSAATDTVMAAQAAPMGASVASASMVSEPEQESTRLMIAPRLGIANMRGDQWLDVQSRFSTGLSIGAEISDNLTFELGYTYSEFGVTPTAYDSPTAQVTRFSMPFATDLSSFVLKQNLIDAGVKIHMLGRDAKMRPYLAGGGGYAKNFLNLDDRIIQQMRYAYGGYFAPYNSLSPDYEFSQVTGYLGAGLDLKLSRNVSVGVGGKYSHILTARENQQLYGQMFYSNLNDEVAKRTTGASISRSGFYVLNAAVSFSF